MSKAAVILSGCGFLDGSEIYETTLTLLELDKRDIQYQCFAPNKMQNKQVNHFNQLEETISRNCIEESARLARSDVKDIKEANPDDFDYLFFPGGFGAALNVCDFAVKSADMQLDPDIEKLASAMIEAKKPLGFICIAPVMIPSLYPEGVKMTIGRDDSVASIMTSIGANHIDCDETECVIDETNKVVSTPAYMLGERISKVHEGISKLVDAVIKMK